RRETRHDRAAARPRRRRPPAAQSPLGRRAPTVSIPSPSTYDRWTGRVQPSAKAEPGLGAELGTGPGVEGASEGPAGDAQFGGDGALRLSGFEQDAGVGETHCPRTP